MLTVVYKGYSKSTLSKETYLKLKQPLEGDR